MDVTSTLNVDARVARTSALVERTLPAERDESKPLELSSVSKKTVPDNDGPSTDERDMCSLDDSR